MIVRAIPVAVCLALLAAQGVQADAPEKQDPLAFNFTLPQEKEGDAPKIPFFRVFPGGKDKNGKNASSVLSTLKLARGESQLYPTEDALPGLIVVLRRLVLVPLSDGDYRAILEGEFNAVQTRLPRKTIQRLLAGETTELVFESETKKGIRPVAFKVEATTTLRAALRKGVLECYGGEGRTTITHHGLVRTNTYDSPPVSLGPADSTKPVYIGRPVKPAAKSDGSPETLPVIN